MSTLTQLEEFPEDIETIQDLCQHGVEAFRIAKHLRSRHNKIRMYNTELIRLVATRHRGWLGMNSDQMKQFMLYAEGIARDGGCFDYTSSTTLVGSGHGSCKRT